MNLHSFQIISFLREDCVMKGDQEEHCSIDSYQAMVSDEYCSLTLHIITPNGISVKKKTKQTTYHATTGLVAVSIREKKLLSAVNITKRFFFSK